jgi:hypothetical protein
MALTKLCELCLPFLGFLASQAIFEFLDSLLEATLVSMKVFLQAGLVRGMQFLDLSGQGLRDVIV